jgi:hypothetical protein
VSDELMWGESQEIDEKNLMFLILLFIDINIFFDITNKFNTLTIMVQAETTGHCSISAAMLPTLGAAFYEVGDVRNLNIWTRDRSRRLITPRGNNLLTGVYELVDPMTGEWDRELIEDMFWEEDVRLILAWPIHEGRENWLAWHYDQRGLSSVRSAYKVCRAEFRQHQTCGDDKAAVKMRMIRCGTRYGTSSAQVKSNTSCGDLHRTVWL